MSAATETLMATLKSKASALVGMAEEDFERFAAPVLRDVDLILSEQDPLVRDQLQRSLHAQITDGVPELARVTGARQAADLVATVTMLGADVLIGLVSQGAVKLSEALSGEDS